MSQSITTNCAFWTSVYGHSLGSQSVIGKTSTCQNAKVVWKRKIAGAFSPPRRFAPATTYIPCPSFREAQKGEKEIEISQFEGSNPAKLPELFKSPFSHWTCGLECWHEQSRRSTWDLLPPIVTLYSLLWSASQIARIENLLPGLEF